MYCNDGLISSVRDLTELSWGVIYIPVYDARRRRASSLTSLTSTLMQRKPIYRRFYFSLN